MILAFLTAKLGKPLSYLAIAAGIALLIVFIFWRGMVAIEKLEARAAESARIERDAFWVKQIAAANAEIQRVKDAEASRAASIESTAATEIARLNTNITELEKRNAELPNAAACGLDRERGRLLNVP